MPKVDQYGDPQYRFEVEVITSDSCEVRKTYPSRSQANLMFWRQRRYWGKQDAEVALHDLTKGITLKHSIGMAPVDYPSGVYHHTQRK